MASKAAHMGIWEWDILTNKMTWFESLKALLGLEDSTFEYRFRRSDGSYAYIFERGCIVHNDTGNPVRMIGAMMDITERKVVQQELQRQNLRSKCLKKMDVKHSKKLKPIPPVMG